MEQFDQIVNRRSMSDVPNDSGSVYNGPVVDNANTNDNHSNVNVEDDIDDGSKIWDNIPLYESSKSIDENDLQTPPKKKRKEKVEKTWNIDVIFSTVDEAKASLENEGMWGRCRTHESADGVKHFYRCNQAKLRGTQCSAGLYHLMKSDSTIVLQYRTKETHDHEVQESVSNLEAEVQKHFDLGLKPKAIMVALSKIEGLRLPSKKQLTAILAKINRRIFGPTTISLLDLSKWLDENSKVPDDKHEAFVLCQEVSDADAIDPFFRFMLTTKHLLSHIKLRDCAHADTTYKIVWQGFPVFMVGTTDWDKSYHPYGLAVCTDEKTEDFQFVFNGLKEGARKVMNYEMKPNVLVSDAAGSIHNGFRAVFGDDVIIVMCWFHAKKAMEKQSRRIVQRVNQEEILRDIGYLHLASTPEMFHNGAKLFISKWNDTESEFCAYFNDEWLIKNPNWFIGAASFTPCHNNALEAANGVLKDSHTFRVRHPLSHFLTVAKEVVQNWSKEYDIGLRTFATKPTIPLKLWTESYNWARSNIAISIIEQTKEHISVEIDASNTIQPVQPGERCTTKSASQSSVNQRDLESSQCTDIASSESAVASKVSVKSKNSISRDRQRRKSKRGSSHLAESSSQSQIPISQAVLSQDAVDLQGESEADFTTYMSLFRKWSVLIPKNVSAVETGSCNCPAYGKNYVCKHVIGLGIRLKYISVPAEAKTIPIGQKRKRGRPTKTKPALLIQD